MSVYFEYHRNLFITMTVIPVIISALLLTLSKYTKMLRKKHINNIVTKKKVFWRCKRKIRHTKAFETKFGRILHALYYNSSGPNRNNNNWYSGNGFVWVLIWHPNYYGIVTHVVDVIVLALSQGDVRRALKYTHNKNRFSLIWN